MKNYLKISMAICLALISNNVFANQQIMKAVNESTTLGVDSTNQPNETRCLFHEYLDTKQLSEDLKVKASNFLGEHIHGIEGKLILKNSTPQPNTNSLIIGGTKDINSNNDERNNKMFCIYDVTNDMFIKYPGTLILCSGNKINILYNSKLLISGSLYAEPNCIINIGSHDNKSEKGTGGYLIINADEPIDLTNLTINLLNKDSHLEIHGNDISISECNIHRFNDRATVHIMNKPFTAEFMQIISGCDDDECNHNKPYIPYKPDDKPDGDEHTNNGHHHHKPDDNKPDGDGHTNDGHHHHKPDDNKPDDGDNNTGNENNPNPGDDGNDNEGGGGAGEPADNVDDGNNNDEINNNDKPHSPHNFPHHHGDTYKPKPHHSDKKPGKGSKSESHFGPIYEEQNENDCDCGCSNNKHNANCSLSRHRSRPHSRYKVDVNVNVQKHRTKQCGSKHNIRKFQSDKV